MIFSPWCVYFDISFLRSIQKLFLGLFWIFVVARASSCCLYDPPALAPDVGQYYVMVLVLVLLLPHINIHDQQPRFLNSWPVLIALHDTLYTAMISVPLLWNGPPEMVAWLYHVLILLILNYLSVLLYTFSFMGVLLQLLYTYASPIIVIPSLIKVFFKVSSLCLLDWYKALPITPMFWSMILILPSPFPPLSPWPQSLQQFSFGFVSVFLAYLSNLVQEAASRYQGPWAPSTIPGSVSFRVVRDVVFSISTIMTFRFSASVDSDLLAHLSFLMVSLNSWVSDNVACFTFDVLVWPVVI